MNRGFQPSRIVPLRLFLFLLVLSLSIFPAETISLFECGDEVDSDYRRDHSVKVLLCMWFSPSL